ncbi:MAG: 50S ribosomal protein L23 [Phycisphaeraceae bacterium]|nr:50S ribosomal protein L23 [Phycisphaeraceae bacterium]
MDLTYVIKRPLLTEKSTVESSERNRFCFEVDPRASKDDVKKAVETLYKVSVEKVNTLITRSRIKRVRTGLTGGKLSKKAFVRLKEGQTIELF